MPRTHQGPAPPGPDVTVPTSSPLDKLVFSTFVSRDVLTERWTAGVRQAAAYLSVDLAMLGRIDLATRIQQLLHNPAYIPKGMYDGARNCWPCLNFAWEAARTQGPGMDDDDALQRRQEEEVAWVEEQCLQEFPVHLDPEKHKEQLAVKTRWKQILDAGIDRCDEVEVVAIMKALMGEFCAPGTFSSRAVRARAIDYLMQKGRRKEAIEMLRLATEAVQMYDHGYYRLHDEMPKLRHAWRLLVTGILCDQLHIDEAELQEKGTHAINVIEQRLREGPARPFISKSMNELVDILETESGYELRNPPATDACIADAEARLGVSLPEELKDFLRISNGFSWRDYSCNFVAINGTAAFQWQSPLIPEHRLSILPEFDAHSGPDIEAVTMDRVIAFNDPRRGIDDYIYLIEPHHVSEARTRLRKYYDTQAEPWMKIILEKSVNDYIGGWAEMERLGWGIMRFDKYNSHFVSGVHLFLEDLVIDSRSSGLGSSTKN